MSDKDPPKSSPPSGKKPGPLTPEEVEALRGDAWSASATLKQLIAADKERVRQAESLKRPHEVRTLPEDCMLKILGKYVYAVAIKRVYKGEADLRPATLLLLMMTDGTVAVFDNTDESIFTTGGLRSGGWQAAMDYLKDSLRVIHHYKLEEVDGKPQVMGDSVDHP